MKEDFDKLSQMSQIEPPTCLYGQILSRIEAKNGNSNADQLIDKNFNKLSTIQNLEVPEYLFGRITARLYNKHKKLSISTKWLSAAAAVFAIIVCVEVFLVVNNTQQTNSNEIEVLVIKEKYQLYE